MTAQRIVGFLILFENIKERKECEPFTLSQTQLKVHLLVQELYFYIAVAANLKLRGKISRLY